MKKINIVKENKDFANIITNASSVKSDYFILYYENNNLFHYRFGISIGKKIGKAFLRNKLKRQLRNIIDKNKKLYSNTKDYIIIVRKKCLNISFQKLEEEFIKIFELIGETNEK